MEVFNPSVPRALECEAKRNGRFETHNAGFLLRLEEVDCEELVIPLDRAFDGR